MSELPKGWTNPENSPHWVDGPDATMWVSDGGLVGVDEAALNIYSKDFEELVVVPLRAVQAACELSRNPQQLIVRWNTDKIGKDLISIHEVIRVLEEWESGSVTSTYKSAVEVLRAMRDSMKG